VVVGQPGRPPVVVAPKPKPSHPCRNWKRLVWLLSLLVLVLLLLLLLK